VTDYDIQISKSEIDQPYSVIGMVKVYAYAYGSVRARADNPVVLEDANTKLRSAAARKGANAVIRVEYEPTYRWFGGGFALRTSGIAVLFTCVCPNRSGTYGDNRCLDCSGVVAD
jgi:hypothetical protein